MLAKFIQVINISLLLVVYSFLILKQSVLESNLSIDDLGVYDGLLTISFFHAVYCFLAWL